MAFVRVLGALESRLCAVRFGELLDAPSVDLELFSRQPGVLAVVDNALTDAGVIVRL